MCLPPPHLQYDFFPITYILPNEYQMFVEEFKRNSTSTWIAKPVGKAQGKGIFLFNELRDIKTWKMAHDQRGGGQRDRDKPEVEVELYVAQRYIENPYLVGGKKFDLRLYALVTVPRPSYSIQPLQHGSGSHNMRPLPEICTLAFSPTAEHMKDPPLNLP